MLEGNLGPSVPAIAKTSPKNPISPDVMDEPGREDLSRQYAEAGPTR